MTYTCTSYQSIYDVSHELTAMTDAVGSIAYLNTLSFDFVFAGLEQINIDNDTVVNTDLLTQLQKELVNDKRIATGKLPAWAPIITPIEDGGIGYMAIELDNEVG